MEVLCLAHLVMKALHGPWPSKTCHCCRTALGVTKLATGCVLQMPSFAACLTRPPQALARVQQKPFAECEVSVEVSYVALAEVFPPWQHEISALDSDPALAVSTAPPLTRKRRSPHSLWAQHLDAGQVPGV